MVKHLRVREICSVLCALIIFSLSSLEAYAATSTPAVGQGNGYKVYPIRTDLIINPATSKPIIIYVQNVSAATENLQVIVNDFQANSNESGTPALLLNGQSDSQHGLKQFIHVLNPTFSLAPGQQGTINANVLIGPNAPGGGYYGAIRVAPAGVVGDKNVNLAASVASLILVKVPGNINENVSIAGFEVLSANGSPHTFFTSNKGLQASVRFQNSGNIQEAPFGKIQLKKGSKVLGTLDINNTTPTGNVLPNSIRKFTANLSNVGSFGKYTIVGNFGYGTTGQLLTSQKSFYVIPTAIILVAIVVVILVILAIFVLPRLIRRYNQRVLRRAGRR